jgi:hypothetical protein
MTDGDQGAEHAERGRMSRNAKVRLNAAIILLLASLVLVWVSFLTPYLHNCDDQVARVGRLALVRSCRPLSVTDPPVLAMLIAAGVLLFSLFPDVSALEVFGVFRLERRLKEQAEEQEKRHADTMQAIHRLEVSQKVSQQMQVNVVAETAARAGELAALQDEKREHFESDAS